MNITDFIIIPCYGSYPMSAKHELLYFSNPVFEGNYKACCDVLDSFQKAIEMYETIKDSRFDLDNSIQKPC